MQKRIDRIGSGLVTTTANNTLQVVYEDGTAELHGSQEYPQAVHHFLPVGCKLTITCHADDEIDGHKAIEISEQKIHTIVAKRDGGWAAAFPVKPATKVGTTPEPEPEPEPQPAVEAEEDA